MPMSVSLSMNRVAHRASLEQCAAIDSQPVQSAQEHLANDAGQPVLAGQYGQHHIRRDALFTS